MGHLAECLLNENLASAVHGHNIIGVQLLERRDGLQRLLVGARPDQMKAPMTKCTFEMPLIA